MTSLKYFKQEFFDPNAMATLLRHDGIDYATKQLLHKYYKRRENGNRVSTMYDFCKDYASSGVGRVFVANSLGLQGFSKDIRNALASGLYWDVDMVNAHPTILVQLCEQKGWNCAGLKHYVENRDQVIGDIMAHYGCSHSDAKNLMLRLVFLGHPQAWVGASICELSSQHLPYILGLKKELETIATNVFTTYTDAADVVKRKKKIDGWYVGNNTEKVVELLVFGVAI
jgi:hypothetical protein